MTESGLNSNSKGRKKILVVLSTSRNSSRIVDEVMKTVKELKDVEVTILRISEAKEFEWLRSQMETAGFLGEKPTDDVISVIMETREQSCDKIVSDLERKLDDAGIPYRVINRDERDYSQIVIKEVERNNYHTVFMVRTDRSRLSRFIHGSEVDYVVKFTRAHSSSRIRILEGK